MTHMYLSRPEELAFPEFVTVKVLVIIIVDIHANSQIFSLPPHRRPPHQCIKQALNNPNKKITMTSPFKIQLILINRIN